MLITKSSRSQTAPVLFFSFFFFTLMNCESEPLLKLIKSKQGQMISSRRLFVLIICTRIAMDEVTCESVASISTPRPTPPLNPRPLPSPTAPPAEPDCRSIMASLATVNFPAAQIVAVGPVARICAAGKLTVAGRSNQARTPCLLHYSARADDWTPLQLPPRPHFFCPSIRRRVRL